MCMLNADLRSLNNYLPTIFNFLGKDSIVVSDTISICRQSERCHGVEEAGCQPTQSSITQTSILLNLLQLLNVKANLLQKYCINDTPPNSHSANINEAACISHTALPKVLVRPHKINF